MINLRFALFLSISYAMIWAACGARQRPAQSPQAILNQVHRFFPLAQGSAWSYDVQIGDGSSTLAISRVTNIKGTSATVEVAGQIHHYELRDEGIWRVDRGVWLLRKPLKTGASWASVKNGRAQVIATGRLFKGQLGMHANCIEIRESNAEQTTLSTYCPDVGLVQLTTNTLGVERGPAVVARLRGYHIE